MKRQKRNISQYRGRTDHRGLILPIVAIFILALAAVCWFLIPGMKFSGELLTCAAAVCFLAAALKQWSKSSSAGTVVRRIFLVCLAVCAVLFAAAEGVIISMGHGNVPQNPSAVLVLGAGVNGSTPSPVLQSRIDAAAEYLKAHPQTSAVLSGGRGDGETVSEAQAMRDGLTKQGISADRLILEENSTTTAENMQDSKKLLKKEGLDTKQLAVVTSDFHICRARFLAKENGMRASGVAAKTPHWWLTANYYTREAFALGHTVLTEAI